MTRRLSNVSSLLSLVLLIGAVALLVWNPRGRSIQYKREHMQGHRFSTSVWFIDGPGVREAWLGHITARITIDEPDARQAAAREPPSQWVWDGESVADGLAPTLISAHWRHFIGFSYVNDGLSEAAAAGGDFLYEQVLVIPAWAPAVSFSVLPAAWLARRVPQWHQSRRGRRQARHGLCGRCGYNLTGNQSGVCPECGTSVPADATP